MAERAQRRHHRRVTWARLRNGHAPVSRGVARGRGHARHPTRACRCLREATGAAADDDRLIGVQLDLLDARVGHRGRQNDRRSRRHTVCDGAQRGNLRSRNGGRDRYGVVAEAVCHQRTWVPSRLLRLCCRRCEQRAKGASCWCPVRQGCAVSRPPRRTRRPRAHWSAGVSRWRSRSRRSVSVSPSWLPAPTTPTIITDAGTTDDRTSSGPYARLHNTMNSRGRFAMRMARPPEQFTDGVVKALADTRIVPPTGCGTGRVNVVGIQPDSSGHRHAPHVADRARHTQAGVDARRGVALTTAQKAMVFAAKSFRSRCCNAWRRWRPNAARKWGIGRNGTAFRRPGRLRRVRRRDLRRRP